MKATKMPSGRWIARANYTEGGVKKRKSFTADTKRRAEMMVMEFLDGKHAEKTAPITFRQAAESYVANREHVLSASTIREYNRLIEGSRLEALNQIPIGDITQDMIQALINRLAVDLSPKSVRNVHGFIGSVLKVCRPDLILRTAMPQPVRPDLYTPTDAEVTRLIQAVRDTRMEIPVLLACMGSLRRSEICALQASDVSPDGAVRVSKAMVYSGSQWILKTTKTETGNRTTYIPPQVAKRILELVPSGPITEMNPSMITLTFPHILSACGLPHFRFHALRSYYATAMHALGIPDKYIMAFGGWRDNSTLQRNYEKAAKDKIPDMAKKGIDHFKDLL